MRSAVLALAVVLAAGGGVTLNGAPPVGARREVMADAVVLLVARRVTRTPLDDLADGLGLSRMDMQGAVRRFRSTAEAHAVEAPAKSTPWPGPQPEPEAPAAPSRVCPQCGATYSTGQGLAVHRRSAHEPRIDCPQCGRSCSANGLGSHRRSAHGVAGKAAQLAAPAAAEGEA
jgi:hypothetical protein